MITLMQVLNLCCISLLLSLANMMKYVIYCKTFLTPFNCFICWYLKYIRYLKSFYEWSAKYYFSRYSYTIKWNESKTGWHVCNTWYDFNEVVMQFWIETWDIFRSICDGSVGWLFCLAFNSDPVMLVERGRGGLLLLVALSSPPYLSVKDNT